MPVLSRFSRARFASLRARQIATIQNKTANSERMSFAVQPDAAKVAALKAFPAEGFLAVLNQALEVASDIKLQATKTPGTCDLHRSHAAS